jgi:hypothetical protein
LSSYGSYGDVILMMLEKVLMLMNGALILMLEKVLVLEEVY